MDGIVTNQQIARAMGAPETTASQRSHRLGFKAPMTIQDGIALLAAQELITRYRLHPATAAECARAMRHHLVDLAVDDSLRLYLIVGPAGAVTTTTDRAAAADQLDGLNMVFSAKPLLERAGEMLLACKQRAQSRVN